MARLSRPYQIALIAIGLFAALWFVALRGHSAGTGGAGSSATAPRASSPAPKPAAPSSTYHGSAPGVAGLTHAIEKAHGAVAQSEQSAKQLEQKSAQASSSSSTGAGSGTSSSGSQPTSSATTGGTVTTRSALTRRGATHRAATHGAVRSGSGTAITGTHGLPAGQVLVEHELKQGNLVALVFFNREGSDDIAVRDALDLLLAAQRRVQPPGVRGLLKAEGPELGDASVVLEPGGKGEEKIFVKIARASEVASFGSFTRKVQIYQTPTILIVNRSGQIAPPVTGLTDAFSIEQAIDEPYPQGRPQT
jgi:hypothetical protein